MNKLYSTLLKSIGFSYKEFKSACKLKMQGISEGMIIGKSVEDNIFLVKTESRRKEFASRIVERLLVLDDTLIAMAADGPVELGKQVNLYAIIKGDLLLFEFLTEVYSDKIVMGDLQLTEKDFNIFFSKKAEQSKQIAGWSDYTYYKMTQVIKRVLKESGMIKLQKKEMIIQPLLLDSEFKNYLSACGESKFLEAISGVKS